MRTGTTRDVAGRVALVDIERIPRKVLDRARSAIVDTIATILAGVSEPVTAIAREVVAADGCAPISTQRGTGMRTSMEGADFLNGISGHALDYDDVSTSATAHPSVVVRPAALVLLRRDHDGRIALVVLNRPSVMNAMNTALGMRLAEVLEEVAEDGRVRAVVLTGAGDRALCAGADPKERRGMTPEQWTKRHGRPSWRPRGPRPSPHPTSAISWPPLMPRTTGASRPGLRRGTRDEVTALLVEHVVARGADSASAVNSHPARTRLRPEVLAL